MNMKRPPMIMTGHDLFEADMPIFVNRAYESFDLREHAHDFIEITYVSEGEGMHYIDGEAVPVQQGAIWYIPEGRSHVFRPRTTKKDRPLIVYNCLFKTAYLTELGASIPSFQAIAAQYAAQSLQFFEVKDTRGEFHALFRELFREYSRRTEGFLAIITALLVRIVTGLHRQRGHQRVADGASPPSLLSLEESIAYIDRHYATELRLPDIAAQASLSERQFSRLFRKQTGMSFTAYVQNARMEEACRLLAASRLSVSDVAAQIGYADMKYFHQLFKRKTGVTPRAYRGASSPNGNLPQQRQEAPFPD
ncbi:AraC-like DNA-binding protein [Paenibacillus phyllosphaerae]|uniref:AraC-like DNA-binding protein n=1 Tax=Paenibacillus phyllosphaerae TaxID=274593 RepID=A0A7W5FN99_9BACL|nr:AraC family transcriptional regulator [Paenibacillus phyllosphaerae]MBB3111085.1 AraC-like DNA-binding protein [Paenibacillus phyllosphaerae]